MKPNSFCLNRSAFEDLREKLQTKIPDVCVTLLQHLCIYANHSPGIYRGIKVKRGQIFVGRKVLETRTGMSPRTLRSVIQVLTSAGEVTHQPTHHGSLITIVNYECYDGFCDQPTQQLTDNRQTSDIQPTTSKETKEEKRRERKQIKTPLVASPEAEICLKAWENHRPLPKGADRDSYLKVFDDLHGIDSLSWSEIHAICSHAVTVWEPSMIQAPSKLRQPSKAYPELKTWQVIQGQIQNPPTHKGVSNGHHPNGNGSTATRLAILTDLAADYALPVYDPDAADGTPRALPEHENG